MQSPVSGLAIRAGETRQGRLRRFDEAIARFVDWNFNCHFSRFVMVPRPLAPARAMRTRYSALSHRPLERESGGRMTDPGNEVGLRGEIASRAGRMRISRGYSMCRCLNKKIALSFIIFIWVLSSLYGPLLVDDISCSISI